MRSGGVRTLLAVALVAVSGGSMGSAAVATGVAGAPYDVRSFGAVGDGATLDTDAINRAIDAASAAGGGTVTFPAGTYLSASIHLRSHVRLFIDQGATIEAVSYERTPYDPPEPNPWDKYQDFGHSHWHNSLIWGEGVEDVSIEGPGLIHGTGLVHLNDAPKGAGNKAIALKNSRNVTIRDISILHGGHFAILATGVDNLTIDNVKIDTNRDGIDVDACRNVRISNVTVNSPFDDGICLKSSYGLGVARATENVTITNSQVSGYDEGTLLDGTFKRTVKYPARHDRAHQARYREQRRIQEHHHCQLRVRLQPRAGHRERGRRGDRGHRRQQPDDARCRPARRSSSASATGRAGPGTIRLPA